MTIPNRNCQNQSLGNSLVRTFLVSQESLFALRQPERVLLPLPSLPVTQRGRSFRGVSASSRIGGGGKNSSAIYVALPPPSDSRIFYGRCKSEGGREK